MNNRIEHVNAGYDPITNWRSHDLEGARSEALSGGVDATRAALLGLTAGKEHSADIQNLAAEETAYRQALFEAQAAIKTYIAEIMATEQELSVAQIQGLQTAQMYADNPEMIDNSLITGADVMDGITIGGAALLFVGEAIWRKTEKMSPESKKIIFALLVLAFGGIACLSNIPSVINTAVAQGATPVFAQGLSPTPTRTQIPTRQPTREPTASKTPTAEKSPTSTKETLNSSFFEELDKNGHDKKDVEDGSIYGVLDEKTVHYAPEGGIKIGNTYIYSWTDTYFYQDGIRQKGAVINYACTEVGGSYYCFSTESDSIVVESALPSKTFVMNLRKAMQEFSPGDKPLTKLELNSKIPGLAEVFGEIFPAFNGKLQVINIPGIGKVIPATHITFAK